MNKWKLVKFYTIYSIVSIFLFLKSTSGYGWLGALVLLPMFYGILWLILLVVTLVKTIKQEIFSYDGKVSFLSMLTVQTIILLFNSGDCGDSPCGRGIDTNGLRNFIFPNLHFLRIGGSILIVLWILYLIFLCLFLIAPFLNSDRKNKS